MKYDDVANYFNMFVFRNMRERQNTKLYDPFKDVYFNYDHHRVWADSVVGANGVPLRELLIASSGDSSYDGKLKILTQGLKTPLNVTQVRVCEPLEVAYLSLDPSRMMFFNADYLGYVDYRGALPGTNRVVQSVLLVASVNGVFYLVDCDIGNKYAVRYVDIMSSSYPNVVTAPGGRFGIPWRADDSYGVIRVSYSEPDLYDETGLTLSREKFRGLAISGDHIVFDGVSEFHYSEDPMYSHVKSDSKISWKVRFARNRSNVCDGLNSKYCLTICWVKYLCFLTFLSSVFLLICNLKLLRCVAIILKDFQRYLNDFS